VKLETGADDQAPAAPGASTGPAKSPAGGPEPKGPVTSDSPPDSGGRDVHLLVPIGFSIAGAGLVAGIVGGALSLSKVSSVKEENGCAEECPSSRQTAIEEELESARTTAWVSNIGFAVAGAGAILGIVGVALTFTGGSDASAETGRAVRGRLTADGFVIEGVF
jgi:hypothetical protein